MVNNTADNAAVKKMSELLKLGAIMLSEACPICSLPLFKLRSGEVVCPTHGRVQIVKTDEEVINVGTLTALDELEKLAVNTINRLRAGFENGSIEMDLESIRTLGLWLDILERVRRLKLLIERSKK